MVSQRSQSTARSQRYRTPVKRKATTYASRAPRKKSTYLYVPRALSNKGFGFPDKLITKLHYSDVGTITCTSGVQSQYVFRLNSIYDPDYTGTGHQPMYRDQFVALYNQYAVISSKIKYTVINTTATMAMVCGQNNDDNGSISTAFLDNLEKPHGTSTVLTIPTGAKSSTVFYNNFDCKRDLGIDPYASQTYKTSVGANPTESYNNGLWAIPFDGATTGTLQFLVSIEYNVMFTELSDVGTS